MICLNKQSGNKPLMVLLTLSPSKSFSTNAESCDAAMQKLCNLPDVALPATLPVWEGRLSRAV